MATQCKSNDTVVTLLHRTRLISPNATNGPGITYDAVVTHDATAYDDVATYDDGSPNYGSYKNTSDNSIHVTMFQVWH